MLWCFIKVINIQTPQLMLGSLCKKQIRVPLSIPLAVCTGDFLLSARNLTKTTGAPPIRQQKKQALMKLPVPLLSPDFPFALHFLSENIYGSPDRSLLWTPYFKTSIWHRSVTTRVIVSPPLQLFSTLILLDPDSPLSLRKQWKLYSWVYHFQNVCKDKTVRQPC